MNPTWNRRTFLATLGLTTAASTLPAATSLTPPAPVSAAASAAAADFAFVSTVNSTLGGVRSINTYRVEDGRWTEILSPFNTVFPVALAAHPTLPILYTASIPQGGPSGDLRRGCVTAISVGTLHHTTVEKTLRRGQHCLSEISRQPLALATTRPRQIAVSPDGRSLLVADYDGGHLNLLPLAPDGTLLPVEHVLKQTGNASGPARPHSVLFHPRHPVAYTTDVGTDQLSLLALTQPGTGSHPRIAAGLSFSPGSGPASLALSPSASFLLVTHQLRPAISVIPLDPATGAFSSAVSHHLLRAPGTAGPTAVNAAGTVVYATTSSPDPAHPTVVSALRLSRAGRLTCFARQAIPHLQSVAALTLRDSRLILVGDGGIVTLGLDPRTGLPGAPTHVVKAGGMTGIVLRRA